MLKDIDIVYYRYTQILHNISFSHGHDLETPSLHHHN